MADVRVEPEAKGLGKHIAVGHQNIDGVRGRMVPMVEQLCTAIPALIPNTDTEFWLRPSAIIRFMGVTRTDWVEFLKRTPANLRRHCASHAGLWWSFKVDPKTLTLTIKHYLNTKPTHKIHIPNILYARPAQEVVRRFGVRPQGLSLKGIIWARDWSRGGSVIGIGSGLGRSFIIKVKGDIFRIGFSVEDPRTFSKVLDGLDSGIIKSPMEEEEEAEIRSEIHEPDDFVL
ncbi:hypothetical protein BU17DRAFT_65028 [Hysterangium stoloniferum]|nr:hypothetical protein BU17DRAFT_65028 [Hysterangium stoloniferum]